MSGEQAPLPVFILGLGLIGGSLALALSADQRYRVTGAARNPDTIRAAQAAGVAAVSAVEAEGAGMYAALEQAELVVLAVPPEGAFSFLEEHAAHLRPGAVVTDVCGVKAAVVARCAPLCRRAGAVFVGGHPMAGKEVSGFAAAEAGLFQGASYILTPEPDTPPSAVAVLEQMSADVGCARVTVTTPAHHDEMIAFTSQLPHVLAGAYVKSPRCPEHRGYSAGSYRDVSRVASVDEELWSELFLLNRDNLCGEIDTLVGHLQECRDAVASGDRDRLRRVLREGREIKQREG